MSDIICGLASIAGVDVDWCKSVVQGKKIDTPVGAGCKKQDEVRNGEPADKPKVVISSPAPALKTKGKVGEELRDGKSVVILKAAAETTLEAVEDVYTLHYGIRNPSQENLVLDSIKLVFVGEGKTDPNWVYEVTIEDTGSKIIKPGQTYQGVLSNFGMPLQEGRLSFNLAKVKVKVNYAKGTPGSFEVLVDGTAKPQIEELCEWYSAASCGKVGESLSDGKIAVTTHVVTKQVNRPPFDTKVYYRVANISDSQVNVASIEAVLHNSNGGQVTMGNAPSQGHISVAPHESFKFIAAPDGERFMGEVHRISYIIKYADGTESKHEVIVDKTLDPASKEVEKKKAGWMLGRVKYKLPKKKEAKTAGVNYLILPPMQTSTQFSYDWDLGVAGIAGSAVRINKKTGEAYVKSNAKQLLPDRTAIEIERTAYHEGKVYFKAVIKANLFEGAIEEALIGNYKTTYELKFGMYQEGAKTIDTITGKTVAESKILGRGEGIFKVAEKHYDQEGNVSYKAVLVRSAYTGLVIRVISQEGEMAENYHHYEWMVMDKWPVSSGF